MIGTKNEKGCKKWLPCVLVLLFVIGTTVAPVTAKKVDKPVLKIIDKKLDVIDDDPLINSFIYNRMLEYEEPGGIPAVKIVVIDGHWWYPPWWYPPWELKTPWWYPKKVVKTFYVVRSATPNQIDIVDTYPDDRSLWTFYPNSEQTIFALDIVITCFEDCVACKKAIHNAIRLGMIAIMVDKKNVPSITKVISKSPWVRNYLPEWAKDFLRRFESKH
jgi:hypothetical protein